MKTSSPERFKCLLVIQDGIGDRPVQVLGGQTPLEAASTPHMNALVQQGVAGLMDIIAPGVTVGTDIGHLALFGQDIEKGRYARGPLEAAGAGVFLQPGDIAFRCNLATVDEDLRILDRRAGRIREEAADLVKALEEIRMDDVEILVRPATEHRVALILRGPALSDRISDSDPGGGGIGSRAPQVHALTDDPGARRTAEIVNRFISRSHQLLRDLPANLQRKQEGELPANFILTRGAGGCRPFSELFQERGLRAACISGECTVLGIARLSGVDAIVTDQMTGNLDTNLGEKAAKAVKALREYDLVYLHLKGCDIAGHDRQPELKRWFIEETDRMVGKIVAEVGDWKNLYFAFAGDHSTVCELGEHTGDPVPVFVSGSDVPADSVTTYGERACAQGGLGRLRCREFLATIFQYLRV